MGDNLSGWTCHSIHRKEKEKHDFVDFDLVRFCEKKKIVYQAAVTPGFTVYLGKNYPPNMVKVCAFASHAHTTLQTQVKLQSIVCSMQNMLGEKWKVTEDRRVLHFRCCRQRHLNLLILAQLQLIVLAFWLKAWMKQPTLHIQTFYTKQRGRITVQYT